MDKNENIVPTRGRHTSEWRKQGYETSVIGRQERELEPQGALIAHLSTISTSVNKLD